MYKSIYKSVRVFLCIVDFTLYYIVLIYDIRESQLKDFNIYYLYFLRHDLAQ